MREPYRQNFVMVRDAEVSKDRRIADAADAQEAHARSPCAPDPDAAR
jgi:hypothetical protein